MKKARTYYLDLDLIEEIERRAKNVGINPSLFLGLFLHKYFKVEDDISKITGKQTFKNNLFEKAREKKKDEPKTKPKPKT